MPAELFKLFESDLHYMLTQFHVRDIDFPVYLGVATNQQAGCV